LLRGLFTEKRGFLEFAASMDLDLNEMETDGDEEEDEDEKGAATVAAVDAFLLQSIAEGAEGLMIKRFDEQSIYKPSETSSDRSRLWVKLKKDYVDGLADSFDVVPIGAWRGAGRKGQWWSPVLLAVIDPETGTLQSFCRCMSGFSDEFYREMRSKYSKEQDNLLPHKPSNVETNEQPTVWFRQLEVWELRAADLSLSPMHKAGAAQLASAGTTDGKGISVRFPRFFRLRPDKSVMQATSSEAIAALYNDQAKVAPWDEEKDEEEEEEEEEDEDAL
jgi:DNA ligase-1